VHDRVEAGVAVVDAGQCARDLAEVGEVDPRERAGRLGGRRQVQVVHLPAVRQQVGHHGPAELAAATGHGHTRHGLSFFAVVVPVGRTVVDRFAVLWLRLSPGGIKVEDREGA
jgi:hypothetical protein